MTQSTCSSPISGKSGSERISPQTRSLTGKLPFPLKSVKQKLEAQRTRKPRPVTSLVEDLPPEVPAILKKMISKRPETRFQEAQDVCRALSPFSERSPAEFSFDKVLIQRAEIARKKIAAKQAHRTGGSSVVLGRSGTTQSTIETSIREKPPSADEPDR